MSRTGTSKGRGLRTTLRTSGLALLLVWILLETLGFPRFVADAVTRRLSESKYLVQASGMRLDLLTGLYFENVSVYRKRLVGPPAIECAGMRVRYNPFRRFVSKDYFPVIEFIDGAIIPSQAAGADEGDGAEIHGLHVVLTDMIIEEMLFEHLSAEVSSTGPQVSVTNIICSLGGDYGEGKASGWMVIDSDGGMAGRVVTQMDPHLLLPMLERIEWKYTCKLIRRFEWPATKPLIDSAFELTPGDDSTFRCESLFSMRDYSYRDVSNDSCDGFLSVNFSPTSGVVSVDNITIGIDERVVVGGFAFDGKRDVVTYRAISDADPKAFFQMVGLFGKDAMENWSFPGVTRFISEGVVDFEKSDGNDTRVLAEIESSGMGIGRLVADTCRFNVNMNGSTCRFTNIEGTIWDGRFVARSDIVFAEDEDVLTFGCAVDDGDFSKVVESLSAEPNNMKGKFSVEMDGRFLLSSNIMDTLTAAGRMSVADGKVFELPIFGGLTEIMAKIIPGLDFVIAQSDMKAEFKVKDGGVSSEKISIVGDVLSLEADGTAGFDGELDFAVQLKLMNEHTVVAKLVRAVTWPISKLMEFRLKGNGDDVQWYPINFSSELLEKVGLKRSDDSGE